MISNVPNISALFAKSKIYNLLSSNSDRAGSTPKTYLNTIQFPFSKNQNNVPVPLAQHYMSAKSIYKHL
jgi:hypothetical protein